MVRPLSGDFDVNSKFRLTGSGSIILLAAAALALGGCGRKGGLDLPPTRAPTGAAVAAPADTRADAQDSSVFNPAFGRKSALDSQSGEAGADAEKTTVFNPTFGTEAPSHTPAPAPKGDSKKSFILDPLLDK